MVMFEMTRSTVPFSSAGNRSGNGTFSTASLTPMAPAIIPAKSTSIPMILSVLLNMFKGGIPPDIPTLSSPRDLTRSMTGLSEVPREAEFIVVHPATRHMIKTVLNIH
jgi:hypothetical protein